MKITDLRAGTFVRLKREPAQLAVIAEVFSKVEGRKVSRKPAAFRIRFRNERNLEPGWIDAGEVMLVGGYRPDHLRFATVGAQEPAAVWHFNAWMEPIETHRDKILFVTRDRMRGLWLCRRTLTILAAFDKRLVERPFSSRRCSVKWGDHV